MRTASAFCFFFQAEDGIRDYDVTGVQTCALPISDTRLGVGAERWFIENKSGGWWHPIHTHLEGHQIQTIDGKLPRRERQYNQDLTLLHGGERAVALVKQRTFTGPFVMHCHTIEHEDMRMMAVIDPQPSDATPDAIDEAPPLDGETRIEPAVSGVVDRKSVV